MMRGFFPRDEKRTRFFPPSRLFERLRGDHANDTTHTSTRTRVKHSRCMSSVTRRTKRDELSPVPSDFPTVTKLTHPRAANNQHCTHR